MTAGVGCPGCGLTRSVAATAHADFAKAVRFHAFGPLIFVAMVVGWFFALLGKSPPWRHKATSFVLIGFAVSMIGYWIFRLTQGTVP